MVKNIVVIAMCCSILALFLGCSGSSNLFQEETLLDKNWGRSYETAKYNQILNPEAGKNLKPVENLDGISSDHTVNKYHESFKKEKKEETTNILKLQ